jgi:hypothetical protein
MTEAEGFATAEDRDGHNEGSNRGFDKLEKMFSK